MRPLALIFALAALPAGAQDLLQVYRDAKGYDAQYAAARFALQAGLEKLPQGRALVLPTLNLQANSSSTRINNDPHNASVAPPTLRDARSYGYSIPIANIRDLSVAYRAALRVLSRVPYEIAVIARKR